MRKYKVTWDCAGWIESKIVEAANQKEARRAARVTRIIKIERIENEEQGAA